MKKNIIIAAFAVLFATMPNALKAQKVGHINFQAVLLALPEYETVKTEYNIYYQALEEELMSYQNEATLINTKYEKEMKKPQPDQIKLTYYEKQIQELSQMYQMKQQSVQDSLTAKQDELTKPLRKKVEEAITAVAKEKGFTHVIDNTYNTLVYADEAYNLESAVKAKLNIKDKPAVNPGAGLPGTTTPGSSPK